MKKKTFLKISIAVIVALALLLAMNAQVFAFITEDTNTGSVTLSGLEDGVTAYIYKLIDVNYNYTADQPEDPAYVWVNEVADWVASYDEGIYIDTTNNSVTSEFNAELESSGTATTFYSSMAAAIKGGTEISLIATDSQVAADGSVTFEDLEMGVYLIIVENGYKVYTPSVASLTPTYSENDEGEGEWSLSDLSLDAKSTEISITKTVTNTTYISDSYSVLDTITFTVVTDVPNYEEDSTTTYTITDTLGAGLTLDTTSIKVYGVNGTSETLLTSGTDYTISTTTGGSKDAYTIDFSDYYTKIEGYSQIKVTYTATLNQDETLVIGSTGNGNTAELTYTNNPYGTETQTISEGAKVYTYGIELTLVDSSATDTGLEGAEFELEDSEGNTLGFIVVDGIYYLSDDEDAETYTTTLITDDNGKVTIYGLDEGTYTLVQTQSTGDYAIPSNKETTIVIEDTGSDGNLTGIITHDEEDGTEDGIYALTITNTAGFSLPTTGGIGTTIFVTVGILLVGCGVALIVASKKRNNK